ncbi:hypothetical protein [Polyangium spumosum]|uniref:DUF4390 domain-containing protein n=1 Tax=Polyangium spumosum TaxID=889282 RepID=A0A6N7PZF4_9BACT|nr:hypothetical protein [Polyangium spumosum]MRG97602.1 hypothetical protein [Polyangium spumosum]
MTRRAALFALALAALFARAETARAEPPKTPASLPSRSATFALEAKQAVISVAFRDVVDAEIQKKLSSGLPTVIVLRAWIFREGGAEPVALTAKTCRVVYDLWDEVFRVQITQPGGLVDTVAVNIEGVLRQCAEARKLRLIERSQLDDAGRYFVAALVEVNPISQETQERIKRWVTRPKGSAAIGPGDSLFGSFVGLFVARIGDADRKLAFRTQVFTPPNPPPPEKKP